MMRQWSLKTKLFAVMRREAKRVFFSSKGLGEWEKLKCPFFLRKK